MVLACIGIFQDIEGKIIVIPSWRENGGPWIDSEKYIIMDEFYTDSELGKAIREAVETSRKNEQEDPNQKAFLKASGLKSWNTFYKKYENVVVLMLDTGEWEIARYLKQKGHSYGLNKDEVDKYTRIFPEPLPPEELGKVVLEMFAMK